MNIIITKLSGVISVRPPPSLVGGQRGGGSSGTSSNVSIRTLSVRQATDPEFNETAVNAHHSSRSFITRILDVPGFPGVTENLEGTRENSLVWCEQQDKSVINN
jgi:hypothetical protein